MNYRELVRRLEELKINVYSIISMKLLSVGPDLGQFCTFEIEFPDYKIFKNIILSVSVIKEIKASFCGTINVDYLKYTAIAVELYDLTFAPSDIILIEKSGCDIRLSGFLQTNSYLDNALHGQRVVITENSMSSSLFYYLTSLFDQRKFIDDKLIIQING